MVAVPAHGFNLFLLSSALSLRSVPYSGSLQCHYHRAFPNPPHPSRSRAQLLRPLRHPASKVQDLSRSMTSACAGFHCRFVCSDQAHRGYKNMKHVERREILDSQGMAAMHLSGASHTRHCSLNPGPTLLQMGMGRLFSLEAVGMIRVRCFIA